MKTNWLRLSEAADYIGIHYTTLRRWADQGDLPVYKTPGGRRRFKQADLDAFITQSQQETDLQEQINLPKLPQSSIMKEIKHIGIREEPWFGQISPDHRKIMSGHGRKLIGVFMQYMSRTDQEDVFLSEGKKLAASYGELSCQTGLSITQTVQAFVMIRHTIVDTLCEAGMVIQDSGEETWQLYRRVNRFFDMILLVLLQSFQDTYLSRSKT